MAQSALWKIRVCLLYTSDAADERSSVDLGGRRIIKKKKQIYIDSSSEIQTEHTQKKCRDQIKRAKKVQK